MKVRIVHPEPDANEDYGCGVHRHAEHQPSEGVKSWQDRHGYVNPVTGALHPKADSMAQAVMSWPVRQYDEALHQRVYEVLRLMNEGRPVKARRKVINGIDEATDPEFQSLLRLLTSPEWARAARVQQIYPSTKGDVFNRQKHGVQSAWVAGTLALRMGLNPWRAVAAAAAHDVGHPAFGHPAEDALDRIRRTISKDTLGFGHAENGALVVSRPHLGFTIEARDSIANHSWSLASGLTPEAALVSLADRIAYVSSDLRDLLTVGVLPWEHIYAATPKVFQLARMNRTQFESIGASLGPAGIANEVMRALTRDVLNQFWASNEIGFTPFGAAALNELRTFIPDQTFRTKIHGGWQDEQVKAVEHVVEHMVRDHRRRGLSSDEATLLATQQFANFDDETAYDMAEHYQFPGAAQLRLGPPSKQARVRQINRRAKAKDTTPLPPLSDFLPRVEVHDGHRRLVSMTVPEALLALRIAGALAPGATRNLSHLTSASSERLQPVVPGPGVAGHEQFVADVRQGIVDSVQQGVELHRTISRRQSRQPFERMVFTGVEALLRTDADLPRAMSEGSQEPANDERADVVIRSCEAYVREHFSRERRVANRNSDTNLELTAIA